MYIRQIRIKNYRNFGNTPFTLQLKPFTLVLGENNVGKTNLLNAIALLFGQDIAIVQRRVLELDDFNYTTVANFKRQVAAVASDAGVEGIAEQVLIPRLFEIHHGGAKTLESVGATVVNVSGVAFSHFLHIVRNGYFRRCVVLTDQDSATQTKDRAVSLKATFDTLNLIQVCITVDTTFEKDLIGANKSGAGKEVLLAALKDTKPINGKKLAERTGSGDLSVAEFFKEIENDYKAEFAFNLARRLDDPTCGLKIPDYITAAFAFLE